MGSGISHPMPQRSKSEAGKGFWQSFLWFYEWPSAVPRKNRNFKQPWSGKNYLL